MPEPGGDPETRGLTVRRFRADEWELLREVRLASLTDSPGAFGSDLEETRSRPPERWHERLAQTRDFVALDAGDRPLGMAGWFVDRELHDAELISMWVAPQARGIQDGRSVARELIEAICADAAAAGHGHVRLWVVADNARAIAAYEKAGFARTGRSEDGPSGSLEIEMIRHFA